MTVTGKEIIAMLKRVSTGTERRTKQFATIMQGWIIRTFDGKNLRLTGIIGRARWKESVDFTWQFLKKTLL